VVNQLSDVFGRFFRRFHNPESYSFVEMGVGPPTLINADFFLAECPKGPRRSGNLEHPHHARSHKKAGGKSNQVERYQGAA
jgi:hypothetical protein